MLHSLTQALWDLLLLSVWPAETPPGALQPFEAYCAKPRLSQEALHVRRRERPLLAKGGIMGEKWPVRFSLTVRLPRHCRVL
jgi:hypothetical protein